MITGIEVSNFKGFRELKLSGLGRYHVLVGPNGSGKSTFFEVLEFVKDLVSRDPQAALRRRRVSSLEELTHCGSDGQIKLQVRLDDPSLSEVGMFYQIWLGQSEEGGLEIAAEFLRKSSADAPPIMQRTLGGAAYYERDLDSARESYSFLTTRGALAQVPPDYQRFPTANRAKKLLTTGVQFLRLDSRQMGTPCPPSLSAAQLEPSGRNLARVAGRLLKTNPGEWLYHLRLALEDLESVFWRQREDDRAEYLVFRYKDGLEIPSYLASFGTLRTLALTLPAFLPITEPRLYLFEEPENGIHPKAIEIVMSAIKSIPHAQTFVTTHSPIVVQQANVNELLLFSRKSGEVIVQHGKENPILHDWDGVPDLGTVVASRILG